MNAPIYTDFETAAILSQEWKDAGLNVVFTNGCFDILHAGHLEYLQEAKKIGDKLIIGLNSDSSVKKLKGKNRPIISCVDRASLLSNLRMIDLVVVFEEKTPLDLIKEIKPDFLVKGGDYKIEEIVGAEFVVREGGEVKALSFVDGLSTSSIIEKIKST